MSTPRVELSAAILLRIVTAAEFVSTTSAGVIEAGFTTEPKTELTTKPTTGTGFFIILSISIKR